MGRRIKLLRMKLKLSQDKFGEMLGLSKASICQYEKGNSSPSKSTLLLMNALFNANIIWLKTGKGDMFDVNNKDMEIREIIRNIIKEDNLIKKKLFSELSKLSDEECQIIYSIAKTLSQKTEQL